MKKMIPLIVASLALAINALAQTATVVVNGPTPNPPTVPALDKYSSVAGTKNFTATIVYPTPTSTPSAIALSVQLPDGWTFASQSGASSAAGPSAGDGGLLEWAFSNFPAGQLQLNFVLNYPAGLTGDQTISVPVAQYRSPTTNMTVPNIVFSAAPEPVFIVTQPTNQTVTSGQDAMFTVTAGGNPAPTYQWRKGTTNLTDGPLANGTVIAGATTATLTLMHVHAADAAANYNVVISNTAPSSITSNDVSLTVNKANQTITFAAFTTKTFGTDTSIALTATASSGLPVSYASNNTGVATINGSTLTIVGAGTAVITASQAGDADYNAATAATQTLTVNKAAQTITFGALPTKTFGDAPITLAATSSAGAGFPISYASSNTAVATISGNTLTIVGAGTADITASQAGNTNVAAATNVTQTLTVNKANQTITFTMPASAAIDQSPLTLTGTASSGLPITYTSSDTNIATVSGSTLTLLHVTAPSSPITITAAQAGNANYNAATSVTANLAVLNASQTLTLATLPATKKFGDAPFAITGTSNRGLLITFVSSNTSVATVGTGTLSGNTTTATVTIVGAGTTTITATQAGNADYAAAPDVSGSLPIAKADQVITFNAPATKTYLDAPFDLAPLASTTASGLTVSFSVVSGPATLSGTMLTLTGAGSVVVKASQAGSANYNAAADVSKTITVNKASQTITFAALPAKTYLDADFSAGATASSGLAVTYASSNTAVATVNATTGLIHIVGAGSTNITASQAGDTNYNAATNAVNVLTVNKATATVTLGANTFTYDGNLKGATATTAPAGLTLSFAYTGTSSSTTAPTNAGTYPVVATVVDNNYQGSATGNVVINKATPTITFNPPASVAVDQSPVTLTATSSAGTAGGPITFTSSDTTVATVSGNLLTLLKAQPATAIQITAKQAGDNNYNAAPDVVKDLVVLNASQTLSFQATQLAGKKFGDAPFTITADSNRVALNGAPMTITFTSSDTNVATVSTGTGVVTSGKSVTTATVTIVGAGTATITASQAGNSDFATATPVPQTLIVAKADQVITFTPPATKTYTDAPFALTATTTATGLTVSFSVVSGPGTISGSTLTLTGAGTVKVRASQAGNANYNAATNVDKDIVVAKANQTITGLAASQIKLRDAGTFPIGATASSGLAVSYTSSNTAAVTVSGVNATVVGLGDATITASQAGDANYNAATNVTGTISVKPVAPIIVSTPPTTITAVQNSVFPVFGPIVMNPLSDPVTFTISSTPTLAGLVVNSANGNISGTPTSAPGAYVITLTATNATGSTTKTINLTLQPPAPVITSAAAVSGVAGTNYTAASPLYTVAATNAATVTVTGLPTGLSLDTTNATAPKIIGTLTQAGNFTATITVTNSVNVSTTLALAISFTLPPDAPVYTGTLTPSGTVGAAFTFTPNFGTSANATAYVLTGTLPAGVTAAANFATTGTISGTPTAAGAFPITIKATRSGVSATANLTVTINAPATAPIVSVTGGNVRTLTVGTAIATPIALTASPAATSFTIGTLPGGLTMGGTATAPTIGGTPTTPGTFNVQITGTNAAGTGPAVTLQFTINPSATAPVITSAAVAQGRVLQPFTYTITSSPTNNGATTYTMTGTLPTGLTFDGTAGVGTITGTPAAGTTGQYVVFVAGSNTSGLGAAMDVTINILPPLTVPVVNSNGSAAGQVGQPFSYTITATNSPTSFNATGLPAGLTLSGAVISGVPATATNGTPANVTLTASNADGASDPKTLAITIDPAPATPVITSGATATGRVNVGFANYTITATNTPTSFVATNLPAGLTVNPTTGVISGTPQTAGTVTSTIAAANAGGLGAAATLTFTIAPALTAPSINSAAAASGQVNVAFTPYQITVTNPGSNITYGLAPGSTALPAGLTLNTTTGLITGSPTAAGTTTVNLIATSDGGTSLPQPVTFTIQAAVGVPVITSAGAVTVTAGIAMTPYTITATNMTPASGPYPSGQGLDAVNLPAGLAANPATGVISGTPTTVETKTASLYGVNSSGQGPYRDLVITVASPPSAPVVNSVNSASAQVGTSFSYTITATNSPTSFEVVGAPAWMTVNTTTGAVAGTPTAPGSIVVFLRASNATGVSGPALLTINVAAAAGAPIITSSRTATGVVGVAFGGYQIIASSGTAITGYVATGLPNGLTLSSSGAISGTPQVSGLFQVTLSATNSSGVSAPVVLSLNIAPSAVLIP